MIVLIVRQFAAYVIQIFLGAHLLSNPRAAGPLGSLTSWNGSQPGQWRSRCRVGRPGSARGWVAACGPCAAVPPAM